MDLRAIGYAASGEETFKHANYEMGHTRRFQSENEYLRERVKSCERGLLSIYQASIETQLHNTDLYRPQLAQQYEGVHAYTRLLSRLLSSRFLFISSHLVTHKHSSSCSRRMTSQRAPSPGRWGRTARLHKCSCTGPPRPRTPLTQRRGEEGEETRVAASR